MSVPLDRHSPIPLYFQFKQHLLQQFGNDEFQCGHSLPPEMDLVKDFQISRATVRRALHEMEHDGYINRIPGKGTFVLRTRIKRGLTRMSSFSEDMRERGQTVSSQVIEASWKVPPLYISEQFQTPENEPLMYIYRLRLADNLPIALSRSYLKIPENIEISLSDLRETPSIWSLLEHRGVLLIETDKLMEASLANKEQARLLDIPVGTALLQVEGMAYSTNHIPLEYSVILNSGERYKYMIHLER